MTHRCKLTVFLLLLFVAVLLPAEVLSDETYRYEIEPRCEDAHIFLGGRARCKQAGKWGLIDSAGTWRVSPGFDALQSTTGMYWAAKKGGRWGFIDRDGKVVEAFRYDAAIAPGAVGETLEIAAVRSGNRWRYLRLGPRVPKDDRWVGDLRFEEKSKYVPDAGGFHEGRAPVHLRNGWGLLSADGSVSRVSGATALFGLFDGLAVARFGKKRGFADAAGRVAIRPRFKDARRFSEGMAAVSNGSRWGFVDRGGELVIPYRFDKAREFSEGIAPVLDSASGRWGYINKNGQWVIRPGFDRAYGFEAGVAIVNVGGKRGFIDAQGAYLIEPTFEDVWRFKEGLAPVKLDGRWGFIRLASTPSTRVADAGAVDDATPVAAVAHSDAESPAHVGFTADVREAQALLKASGFNPGPVDGQWGARTETAVKAFQTGSGLVRTGYLDWGTVTALRAPLYRRPVIKVRDPSEKDMPPEVFVPLGHAQSVVSIHFLTNGRYTVTRSEDETVKVWETETARLIRTIPGFEAFSADGRLMLARGSNQTLRLWEREGLIRPIRSQGNTRLYDDHACAQLEAILTLTRDLGVNLAGVEIILNLKEQLSKVQAESDMLKKLVRRALRAENQIPRYHALVKVETSSIQTVEEE